MRKVFKLVVVFGCTHRDRCEKDLLLINVNIVKVNDKIAVELSLGVWRENDEQNMKEKCLTDFELQLTC